MVTSVTRARDTLAGRGTSASPGGREEQLLAMLPMLATLLSATDKNLFAINSFYVNPSYQAELETSIKTAHGAVKSTLKSMKLMPSAYWIDKKDKIRGTNTSTLEGILKDAHSKPHPPLCVFMLYGAQQL